MILPNNVKPISCDIYCCKILRSLVILLLPLFSDHPSLLLMLFYRLRLKPSYHWHHLLHLSGPSSLWLLNCKFTKYQINGSLSQLCLSFLSDPLPIWLLLYLVFYRLRLNLSLILSVWLLNCNFTKYQLGESLSLWCLPLLSGPCVTAVVILQIRVKISQCDVVCYIYLAPSSVHLLLLSQQVIWTSITVMSSGTFVWFSHPLGIYVQGVSWLD